MQRSTDFAAHSRPVSPDSGSVAAIPGIPACVNCDAVPQAAVNWLSPGATERGKVLSPLPFSVWYVQCFAQRTESRTRIKYGLYFVPTHETRASSTRTGRLASLGYRHGHIN